MNFLTRDSWSLMPFNENDNETCGKVLKRERKIVHLRYLLKFCSYIYIYIYGHIGFYYNDSRFSIPVIIMRLVPLVYDPARRVL